MVVTVRLFATLRQQAGWAEKRVELAGGATLADLLSLLEREERALTLMDRPVYAAINKEYAQPEAVLSEGDEIALFPPVSGG